MQSTLDLAYNTDHNDLVIPEYGRNIHQMVQHAMTISDKNERNKCAETIIKVMDLINPNAKKTAIQKSIIKNCDHIYTSFPNLN